MPPFAPPPADLRSRYERAERFCEWNVRAAVRNVTVRPAWTGDGDRFWYERQVDGGVEIVVVDPEAATSEVVDDRPEPEEAPAPPGRVRSPDGRFDVVLDGHDLALEEVASGRRWALTHDGAPHHDHGSTPECSTSWLTDRRAGVPLTPVVRWSPDGRHLLTHRLDQRDVPELHLTEQRPADGVRPRTHTLRVPFPGDPLPTAQLLVIDVSPVVEPDGGEVDDLPPDRFSVTAVGDPLLVEFLSPLELGWAWWADDGATVWFLREGRGASSLALCAGDPATGSVRVVVEDHAESYVEAHPLLPWPWSGRVLPSGDAVVWPAERDGWRHLYLHATADGRCLRQLTSGEWAVREVLWADDDVVVFTACGREPGRDPYLRHVYRVAVSGGEPDLLTPEVADHAAVVSPSGRFLVDTASTVDTAPVTRLRSVGSSAGASLVAVLETADLSALDADGWRRPERFTVTSADGGDTLHGVLFLPSDFDPALRYPVIESLYPGPQLIRTPVSLTVDDSAGVDAWPGPWGAQALAELGFVVVVVDGPGTPLRSRSFHHATVGRLEAHALDDHVAALRQLARERPWMDMSRVGAQGHSAGAAAAVRALISHPDVYSVAVAGSGVHDIRCYLAYWGEKYQGVGDRPELGIADWPPGNVDLAHDLRGRVLLMHGELDDNVPPANSFAMFGALERAGIEADLVILAGESHACWTNPTYVRRTWDHFVRHLMGAEPPA